MKISALLREVRPCGSVSHIRTQLPCHVRRTHSTPLAVLEGIFYTIRDPRSYRQNWIQGTLTYSATGHPNRASEQRHHWYCGNRSARSPYGFACRNSHIPLGSGKTAAFVIPMLAFISKLPPFTDDNRHLGPYSLILAPTRELAQQIESESKKFASQLGFTCVSIVGGVRIAIMQRLHLGSDPSCI